MQSNVKQIYHPLDQQEMGGGAVDTEQAGSLGMVCCCGQASLVVFLLTLPVLRV